MMLQLVTFPIMMNSHCLFIYPYPDQKKDPCLCKYEVIKLPMCEGFPIHRADVPYDVYVFWKRDGKQLDAADVISILERLEDFQSETADSLREYLHRHYLS